MCFYDWLRQPPVNNPASIDLRTGAGVQDERAYPGGALWIWWGCCSQFRVLVGKKATSKQATRNLSSESPMSMMRQLTKSLHGLSPSCIAGTRTTRRACDQLEGYHWPPACKCVCRPWYMYIFFRVSCLPSSLSLVSSPLYTILLLPAVVVFNTAIQRFPAHCLNSNERVPWLFLVVICYPLTLRSKFTWLD